MKVHIIDSEAFLEGGQPKFMYPLCGDTDPLATLIPLAELAYMDVEQFAIWDICEDCQDHPDFVMAILGNLP